MKITLAISLWVAIILVSGCACFEMNEPQCVSRFDYDYKVLQKLISLENSQTELRETMQQQQVLVATLKETMKENKENIQDEKQKLMPSRLSVSLGTTYTRWGRTSCPRNGTQLVYGGYAAGSLFSYTGGAANYLCLPNEPKWGHFEDSLQSGAEIYGVEYQLNGRNRPTFFGRELYNHDAPCAVCVSSRPTMLMIPGRNVCYDGWTLEYHGYLVAGSQGHNSATEFVCLDVRPEVIEGGDADTNGKLFYFAEARCGSLKCPPYVNGRELTCVVCTK